MHDWEIKMAMQIANYFRSLCYHVNELFFLKPLV